MHAILESYSIPTSPSKNTSLPSAVHPFTTFANFDKYDLPLIPAPPLSLQMHLSLLNLITVILCTTTCQRPLSIVFNASRTVSLALWSFDTVHRPHHPDPS